ncbi:hypothetical protein [Parafrankia sp. BMG5.11]|uniref:arsenate reductase/protein-tyrosine-phosphatase family protein n=1 Tax=Parafrankia sp. BMG5.11 TaxID=222540 RepID=UPI0027D285A8|nr:hypothetical protein [Parafrankia sp. BMG5.11]
MVCTGNICRSPMAERFTMTRLARLAMEAGAPESTARGGPGALRDAGTSGRGRGACPARRPPDIHPA